MGRNWPLRDLYPYFGFEFQNLEPYCVLKPLVAGHLGISIIIIIKLLIIPFEYPLASDSKVLGTYTDQQ